MNNDPIYTHPTILYHKINQKSKDKTKKVEVWRALDPKTFKYILTNKYFPDTILVRNNLEFLVDLRKQRYPELYSKEVATA